MKINQTRDLKLVKRKKTKQLPFVPQISIHSNILFTPSSYQLHPPPQEIVANNYLVHDFTITNGQTTVQWKGPLNLRTAIPTCLSQLIDLGKDYIDVYRDGSMTPPIGRGFNRECIAVFTNGKEYISKCTSYSQLLGRLRKLCLKVGVQLISFDLQTFEWKVKISHFTKYLFSADGVNFLDEEEQTKNAQVLRQLQNETQQRYRPTVDNYSMRETIVTPYGRDISKTYANMNRSTRKQVPPPQPPLVYTNKLKIPMGLWQEVRTSNTKYNKNSVNKDFMMLRFGGSGFKFHFQRSKSDYRITASIQKRYSHFDDPMSILSNQQLPSLLNNHSQVIPHLLQRNLPANSMYLLTLIHILYSDRIKYCVQPFRLHQLQSTQYQYNLVQSLRAWFQRTAISQPVANLTEGIKFLAHRRVIELHQQLIRQEQYSLAQCIIKIQEPVFRSIFTPSEDYPTELQQIFLDDHSFNDKQTWLIQAAMATWYFVKRRLSEYLLQILEKKAHGKNSHQPWFRLLRVWCMTRQKKSSQPQFTNTSTNIDEDIQQWFISNLLGSIEKNIINPTDYKERRLRQLHNLVSKLPGEYALKVISRDGYLNNNMKKFLIKGALRKIYNFENFYDDPLLKPFNIQGMANSVQIQRYMYCYMFREGIHELQEIRPVQQSSYRIIQQQPYLTWSSQDKQTFQKVSSELRQLTYKFGTLSKYRRLQSQHQPLIPECLQDLLTSISNDFSTCDKALTHYCNLICSKMLAEEHKFSQFFKSRQNIFRKMLALCEKYADRMLFLQARVLNL